MSRETDLQINCAVRRVFVRHWIDLGQLVLRTTNGAVCLSGRLQPLRNAADKLSGAKVLVIASEIRRIQSVRRVTMHFENWACCEGIWNQVDTKQSTTPLLHTPVAQPAALDLTELMDDPSLSGSPGQ